MDKTHVVIANKGFISSPMNALAAYRFGYQLKQLGNDNVKVMQDSDVKAYQAWKEE